MADYCSKACSDKDLSRGAIVKNQDAIYKEIARARSKSPMTAHKNTR